MEQDRKIENEAQEIPQYTIIQKKRLKLTALIFVLFSLLFIGRLFYIQVYMYKEYSKKAVNQRMVYIPISANRGEIYDRNMIPFTDREIKKVIIVYPDYIYNKSATVETIAKACGLSKAEIEKKISGAQDTVEFVVYNGDNEHLALIESGRIKGVIAVEKKIRYSDDSIARHVVGYIGKMDKIGQMGIEKSMNNYLAGNGNDSIAAVVDSSKNIIPGLGFRKVEASRDGENYSIKLTLDYHMQNIIEEIMEENKIKGSVVLMDVKTGDILGMASKPDFDQNNLNKYMESEGSELINKSVWQFDLGSIFKAVVAAAALENNVITGTEKYKCTGSVAFSNYEIKCSTYKTHADREIDIKEAFALSCNSTYVNLGMQVGADRILEMAQKLGLSQKQCFTLPEEKAGLLPSSKEDGIGNISIGQGKIQATPLQVASLMATIANDGVKCSPQLVDELVNARGITIRKLDRSRPEPILSPRTARMLKEMLLEVTRTGTGKQANMDDYGGSGGKTSSAQTGINQGDVVHGWFSGFFPYNNPQYAMTVFIYNGQSGGGSAAPVFKDIAVRIMEEIKR